MTIGELKKLIADLSDDYILYRQDTTGEDVLITDIVADKIEKYVLLF